MIGHLSDATLSHSDGTSTDGASESRLRALLRFAPVVLFEVDQTGTYTYIEGNGLKGLDVTPAALLGRSVHEVHAADRQLLTNVTLALRGLEFSDELSLFGRWFEIHFSPRSDTVGQLRGFRGVAVDVSERRYADRAREELLSILSHDLRTPMAAIQLHATVLDRILAGRSTKITPEQALNNIRQSVAEADDLIRDLMDYAQIQTGTLNLKANTGSIEPLLRRAMDAVTNSATKHQVTLTLTVTDSAALICDEERVEQAFRIVLERAISLCQPRTTISIRTAIRDKAFDVVVSFPPVSREAPTLSGFYGGDSRRNAADIKLSIASGIFHAHRATQQLETLPAGTRAALVTTFPRYQQP
jgi:PAS domain S-box-containing protein